MKWFYYALAAAILWGLSYSLCEKILMRISTVTLVALEMLIGAIIFLFFFISGNFFQDISIILDDKNLLILVSIDIIVFLVANYCIWHAVKLSNNASLTALIEIIYPIFSLFFSYILFKILKVNYATMIGGILILIGVWLIKQNTPH